MGQVKLVKWPISRTCLKLIKRKSFPVFLDNSCRILKASSPSQETSQKFLGIFNTPFSQNPKLQYLIRIDSERKGRAKIVFCCGWAFPAYSSSDVTASSREIFPSARFLAVANCALCPRSRSSLTSFLASLFTRPPRNTTSCSFLVSCTSTSKSFIFLSLVWVSDYMGKYTGSRTVCQPNMTGFRGRLVGLKCARNEGRLSAKNSPRLYLVIFWRGRIRHKLYEKFHLATLKVKVRHKRIGEARGAAPGPRKAGRVYYRHHFLGLVSAIHPRKIPKHAAPRITSMAAYTIIFYP